ncbi:hypothetical protein Scep_014604 [Stephania cephalantha]|uniref:Uncharacterized protein n=1 Tax=Stephania cephalantha TaxID=152367 RepID=A0AAP0J1M6_9MAGN
MQVCHGIHAMYYDFPWKETLPRTLTLIIAPVKSRLVVVEDFTSKSPSSLTLID